MRAPCWKQSTGYIPEDLQARHVKYVLRHALVLAGNANQQLNQFRRDSLKLTNNMRQLAKDAPEEDDFLFGDDLDKRILAVQATGKKQISCSASQKVFITEERSRDMEANPIMVLIIVLIEATQIATKIYIMAVQPHIQKT